MPPNSCITCLPECAVRWPILSLCRCADALSAVYRLSAVPRLNGRYRCAVMLAACWRCMLFSLNLCIVSFGHAVCLGGRRLHGRHSHADRSVCCTPRYLSCCRSSLALNYRPQCADHHGGRPPPPPPPPPPAGAIARPPALATPTFPPPPTFHVAREITCSQLLRRAATRDCGPRCCSRCSPC